MRPQLTKVNGFDAIEFKKPFWNAGEIFAGECFGFTFSQEANSITAIIARTSKRSLFEFIKLAFKKFNEDLTEKLMRDQFYGQLKKVYETLSADVDSKAELTLPYFKNLYSHQVDVIREAYYKQYNFLALDMGLGKSLSSASLSRLWQSQCTLIVCPAAVKYNWFRDLKKFGFNDLFFTILDSSKKRSIKGFQERFVIINYEMLKKFESYILALPIQHFIFDEAHGLKSISTDKYKNTSRIVKEFPNAKITFLSGTPVKNRVDDVYAYLKLIGHPLGKNKNQFLNQYTIRQKFRVTGAKNLNDLNIKLSNFFIRKTKQECLDLPDKIFMSYRYELDDYKKEYDGIMAELSQQKSLAAANGNIHALNNVTSKAKVKGVIEIADSIMEQDRKVVIFGTYRESLGMLKNHFGEASVKIDGSVNAYDRDIMVQKFHNDPNCKVFIGNIQAAGVGINLTNASDVIFINHPFTPAEYHQAIDRLHRIGQKNSVNVHNTFADDTLDDYIFEIIAGKERDINKLVDRSDEAISRENFTEVLLKKLFNRNGVHDNLPSGSVQRTEESIPTGQRETAGESNKDISELPSFL